MKKPPPTAAAWFANARPIRPALPRTLCAVAVDAEEDFDWLRPVRGTAHDTACMRNLGDFQSIAGAYGVRPMYLLTYPVLEDADAVRGLRRRLERGECCLGVQLHPWVTPPFDGDSGIGASFAGNLCPVLEERKLVALMTRFEACFGFVPRVFRAGRYGLGPATAGLLERHGFEVDVSVAPRTRFTEQGGPDFSGLDCAPFWFGAARTLLEIPLCRSIVGWGGALARGLYQWLPPGALAGRPAASLLTRARVAERLTLSPEGNDSAAMRRLARGLRARGQPVLTLSLHSSSLELGRSPYVRSRAELHAFYDRLSATLAFLADDMGCRFAGLSEMPELLAGGPDGTAA